MSSQNTNEPCSILDQDGKCGETETLAIMQEFKRLYENKMTKIDSKAGGDNLPGLQAKLLLQREWIRDLTAQNELLVKAVEELENNATERVLMLESQLRSNAEKGTEGCSGGPCFDHNKKIADLEKTLKDKEKEMEELTMKYKLKNEEANAAKRSLMDIRNALTVEVAEKHDVILSLRRDVQLLEEQLRQSNKQILFKDDIIKELRKEIKVFKDEIRSSNEPNPLSLKDPDSSLCASSTVIQHECCPYVKDFCPILKLKNTKSLSKRYLKSFPLTSYEKFNKDLNSKINKNGQHNEALIFMREESPTHDYTSKRSQSVEKTKKISHNANKSERETKNGILQKGIDLLSVNSSVDDNWFQSTCVRSHKPRSKLTATKILHEYYGVIKEEDNYCSSLENFHLDKVKKKQLVVPKHMPVKTFVTNLEKQGTFEVIEKK